MKQIILLSLSILVLIIPLTACVNSDKEAVISFTRQVLEIEKQRNSLAQKYTSIGYAYFFINGDKELPGIRSLKSKLLLINNPQSLQSIKDSLVEIYRLEIEGAEKITTNSSGIEKRYYYPSVNYQNVDSMVAKYANLYRKSDSWIIAQFLRKDIYPEWGQILKDNDIDASKEGFTELIIK